MSTYTPIASLTLSAATSSVTFSSIPQTYTDLVLVVFIPSNSTNDDMYLQYNSDTGSNYSYIVLRGNGTNASSTFSSNTTGARFSDLSSPTTTTSCAAIINIMNYANTTTYKTNISRSNNASTGVDSMVTLWRNTAAITSVKVYPASGNMASGSTFNLYGIDAELSAQAKAYGGDTIVTDGTYWYHVFNTSGTFTPTAALTADYLVVAGGGAGGHAGGGGAGGFRAIASQSLTAQNYTVTVGAGGASYLYNPNRTGSSGSNSVFNGFTSTGGGRGSTGTYAASNGGSGGGGNSTAYGGGFTTAGISSPTTSPVQGNSGGGGGGGLGGGGGGGAGGAGSGQSGDTGGAGGAGANSYNSITVTSWLTATSTGVSGLLAGGGGGGGSGAGAGGSGGGGAGATGDNNATSGTANTGSGGGGTRTASGSANTALTGAGGSGIVIIRYAV